MTKAGPILNLEPHWAACYVSIHYNRDLERRLHLSTGETVDLRQRQDYTSIRQHDSSNMSFSARFRNGNPPSRGITNVGTRIAILLPDERLEPTTCQPIRRRRLSCSQDGLRRYWGPGPVGSTPICICMVLFFTREDPRETSLLATVGHLISSVAVLGIGIAILSSRMPHVPSSLSKQWSHSVAERLVGLCVGFGKFGKSISKDSYIHKIRSGPKSTLKYAALSTSSNPTGLMLSPPPKLGSRGYIPIMP